MSNHEEPIYTDSKMIQKWLEGKTIQSIMYGMRDDDISAGTDDKFMSLTLYLTDGSVIDLWAVPGDFTGATLTAYFEHNTEPRPYLAVSSLIDTVQECAG